MVSTLDDIELLRKGVNVVFLGKPEKDVFDKIREFIYATLTKEDAEKIVNLSYKKLRKEKTLEDKLKIVFKEYRRFKQEIEKENQYIPGLTELTAKAPILGYLGFVAFVITGMAKGTSYLKKVKDETRQKLVALYMEKKLPKELVERYEKIAKENNYKMFLNLNRERFNQQLNPLLEDFPLLESSEANRVVIAGVLLSQLGNKYYFTYAVYLAAALENPEFAKEIYEEWKEIYDLYKKKRRLEVRNRVKQLILDKAEEIRDVMYRTWKESVFFKTSEVSLVEYFSLAATVVNNSQEKFLTAIPPIMSNYKALTTLEPYEGRDVVDLMLYYTARVGPTKRKNKYSFKTLRFLQNYFGFRYSFPPGYKKVKYLMLRGEELKQLGIGEIEESKRNSDWVTCSLVIYDFEKLKEYLRKKGFNI